MPRISPSRLKWACAGLALGIAVSLLRGWSGPEESLADRPTLEAVDFERLLLQRDPAGRPFIKDIRTYRTPDGGYWLAARQLARRGNTDQSPAEYLAVKVPTKVPYKPADAHLASLLKPGDRTTVIDLLTAAKTTHPELDFSTRWWDTEPARSSIFALAGLVLIGGAGPLLTGTHAGSARDLPEPRKSTHKPPPARKPVKKSPPPTRAPTPAAPMPTSSADPKRYAGEFYPTETHVRRDEPK